MMYCEFVERTKVEVSWEDYRIIEESYYDFDGNKDEFCKKWLNDYKDGHWERELKLRKKMAKVEDALVKTADKLAEREKEWNELYAMLAKKNAEQAAELEKVALVKKMMKEIFA